MTTLEFVWCCIGAGSAAVVLVPWLLRNKWRCDEARAQWESARATVFVLEGVARARLEEIRDLRQRSFKSHREWERKYANVRRALDPNGLIPEPLPGAVYTVPSPAGVSLVDLAKRTRERLQAADLRLGEVLANGGEE